MRVDLYRPATTIEAPGQASRESTAGPVALHQGIAHDKTTLSPAGESIGSLTTRASQQDPSRLLKIEALKQQVSSGNYTLDTGKTAAALVEHYV